MPKPKSQCWLVKSEPSSYSWEQFVSDRGTAWTGVRNNQARINLRAMQEGDRVFFYHSVVGKEVVGIAKVTRTAYPDPTADEEGWVCVDLAPVKAVSKPVSLDRMKSAPSLEGFLLLRNSRLSVVPVSGEHFETILKMASS